MKIGRLIMLTVLAGILCLSCDLLMIPRQVELNITREVTLFPQDDGYAEAGSRNFTALNMTINTSTVVALLIFNLDGIPSDATITTARLYMRSDSVGAVSYLYCHPVIQDWDTATIDYATASSTTFYDAFEELFYGMFQMTDSEIIFSWDFRNIVQRWISGYPNYGILIRGESTTDMYFCTSESSYSPELFIRYELDIADDEEE